jgi:hypothetical protein
MYAGMFALMLVAAMIMIPHAVADKQDKSERKSAKIEQKSNRQDKAREVEHNGEPKRLGKLMRQESTSTGVGVGAAIDGSGNLHRSHYRVDLATISTNSTTLGTNSTSTNSTNTYQVKKGQIFILEKGRDSYKIIPETWKIDVTDGKSTFNASGQVKGGKNTYNISLTGTKIRDVANGSLYRVDGKLGGNGTEYDLHYISTFSKKNRPVEAIDASE